MEVSIIIPVYNVEDYIEKCLNSLLNQTYKNFEIIIVDDGSTDNTVLICNKIREKDYRIKVYKKDNKGVSSARNIGISKATGNWIVFVDGDDWADKNMILKMYKLVCNYKCDIGIINFNYEYIDKSLRNNINIKANYIYTGDEKQELMTKYILCKGLGMPWGKIFKKDLLIKNKIVFPEKLSRMEDVIFNLYAFQCCKSVCYDSEVLYHYRLQSGSSCNVYNANFNTEASNILKEIEKFIYKFSLQKQFSNSYYEAALYLLRETIRIQFTSSLCKLKYREKIKYINQIILSKPYCNIYNNLKYYDMTKKWKLIVYLLGFKLTRIIYGILKLHGILNNKNKF